MSLPVDKALRKAQSHIKVGELAEAEKLYKQVLAKFPKNKKAIQGYQKLNVGITSRGSSGSQPPQEQINELVSLYNQGQFEEVLSNVKPLVSLFPKAINLFNIQGASYAALQKYDAAVDSYKQAIKFKPNYAGAYYNMGVALQNKGDFEETIYSYKQAIKIKPDYAEAYYNMGIALKDKGELDAAIDSYKQAIKIKPDYAEAYSNMGVALNDQGELDAAIDSCKQAIKIKPDYAKTYYNMGTALRDKGELDAAIDSYKQALKIKPNYAGAYYNSSFALLNSGRLKEGLDEYEWRWKTPQFLSMQRHFSQPLWDGEISLQNKRILVWCEQGLGDTLKWSSRLSVLATQSGHCILECQEKIVPLLSRSFPNVEVKAVDISRDTERDDFDLHLPMGSLYRHFITEITQNSKPDAFLIPDPVRVKFWKDRLSSLGNGPNVGISWKSSDMGAERSKHFSSLSEWSSLFALPNINFINLQYADAADGLLQIQNEFGVKVHNFDDLDQYNDLDEVAALSAALDGVVSFGTSVPMITAGVGTLTKCAALDHHLNFHNSPVGPFLDTYERKVGEPWSNVFGLIANDITKL